MDFSLEFSLGQMGQIPSDPLGWALYVLPAALAVWTERSGQRLARGEYFWALVWRVLGVLVLSMIVLGVLLNSLTWRSGGVTFARLMDPDFIESLWPQLLVLFALQIFITFLFVRVVVQRMRDAGIDQKWAYLVALPIIDLILMIGLIFYPPSKAPADTQATAASQS